MVRGLMSLSPASSQQMSPQGLSPSMGALASSCELVDARTFCMSWGGCLRLRAELWVRCRVSLLLLLWVCQELLDWPPSRTSCRTWRYAVPGWLASPFPLPLHCGDPILTRRPG